MLSYKTNNRYAKTTIVVSINRQVSFNLVKKIIQPIDANLDDADVQVSHPVAGDDVLGKLMAQCTLQEGLSEVYSELLSNRVAGSIDSTSSEIYIKPLSMTKVQIPVTFNELSTGFPMAIPIGYIKDNQYVLNPRYASEAATQPLDEGSSVVFVANNDNPENFMWLEPAFNASREVATSSDNETLTKLEEVTEPKQVLVLGSGYKAAVVVREMTDFLPAGSSITCVESIKDDINGRNKNIEIIYWPSGNIQALLKR